MGGGPGGADANTLGPPVRIFSGLITGVRAFFIIQWRYVCICRLPYGSPVRRFQLGHLIHKHINFDGDLPTGSIEAGSGTESCRTMKTRKIDNALPGCQTEYL